MLPSRGAQRRGCEVDLRERVERLKEELLGELEEFLRMPSISAQKRMLPLRRVRRVGREEAGGGDATARIMETEGHPVVYAEAGEGDKTLLSYGHYDGSLQSRWTSGRATPSSQTPSATALCMPAASPTTSATSPPASRPPGSIARSTGRHPSSSSSSSRRRRRSKPPTSAPVRARERGVTRGRRLPVGGCDEGRGRAADDPLRHKGPRLRRAAR